MCVGGRTPTITYILLEKFSRLREDAPALGIRARLMHIIHVGWTSAWSAKDREMSPNISCHLALDVVPKVKVQLPPTPSCSSQYPTLPTHAKSQRHNQLGRCHAKGGISRGPQTSTPPQEKRRKMLLSPSAFGRLARCWYPQLWAGRAWRSQGLLLLQLIPQ